MNRASFVISIAFDDGTVRIGGDDEFVVEVNDGFDSVALDDERLTLIRLVREAEIEATDAA